MADLSTLFARLVSSGPVGVFLIFLLPWGPGAPAGIVLARREGLSPLLILGLYALSDVVTAVVLEPIVHLIRQYGGRTGLGRRLLSGLARVGTVTRLTSGRLGLPLGLATFTFVTDFFTASITSTALPLGRILAWACIIIGDVAWFVIILLASLGIAAFLSDDRLLFAATLVIGLALPPLVRRLASRRDTANEFRR
jgi:hypothetical protein